MSMFQQWYMLSMVQVISGLLGKHGDLPILQLILQWTIKGASHILFVGCSHCARAIDSPNGPVHWQGAPSRKQRRGLLGQSP